MTAATPEAPMRLGRSSRSSGIAPLLFAAYPALFLWSQNIGETDAIEVIGPLLLSVAVAALATVGLALILHDVRRAAVIVSPGILIVLMYGHVARILSGSPVPVRFGQLALAALLIGAVMAAVRLGPRTLELVDTALTRIALILIGVTVLSTVPDLLPGLSGRPVLSNGGDRTYATSTKAPMRDVWYIIFDRYGSDEALRLRYGYDNDLPAWLQQQGFTILPDSHANYGRTSLSIPSTVNLTHLDTLAARMDPASHDYGPVRSAIRSSVMARQFKALGYHYDHVGSWWNPTAEDPIADVNYRLDNTTDFAAVFFETTALPKLTTRLGLTERPASAKTRNYEHGRFSFDALDGLVDGPSPKFVFAHVLLPHPPIVFDRDGGFLDAAAGAGLDGTARFVRQLEYTNSRIRRLVQGLIARPEAERPIIILQADEGPYPASYQRDPNGFTWADASEDDLQTKFGVLNAWYLPGGEDFGLYPSMTLINTFPTLFAGYFGLDYDRLPDTVWASRGRRQPYQLIDITDRLPTAHR